MSGQKITVEEYMEANKIKSRQTVYNRVQSGQLKSEKIDNRLYIILDNEIKESVQEDWTAEIIKNTVLDKDRQIEELKKRIESAEEEKKKTEEIEVQKDKEKEITVTPEQLKAVDKKLDNIPKEQLNNFLSEIDPRNQGNEIEAQYYLWLEGNPKKRNPKMPTWGLKAEVEKSIHVY